MGLFFGGFVGWQMLILYRADAPFPMSIGEVLSVLNLFLVLLDCLWGIALLEINS